jgi:uridylate kinase
MKYERVVIKLSGQAMAGADGFGFSAQALQHLASQIVQVRKLGVQIAVVVGGGNVFRGNRSDSWGIDRVEADNIGMLGTVMNALMMRGALTARTSADVRVMTAIPMQSVAEPYIRLRAMSHLGKGSIVILAGGIGQPYVTTDYPSVQRALELDADALLVAKRGVDGIYDADPKTNPQARRYDRLTYAEAIDRDIKVMDTSAFVLAGEQGLTMHVFDIGRPGSMRSICTGDDVGTLVTR